MQQSLQQLAASRTRRAAMDVIAAAHSTQPDKLHWVPMGEARPIIDQLEECLVANNKWTRILRNRVYGDIPAEEVGQIVAGLDSLDKLTTRLTESAEELATVILSVQDNETGDEIPTPWGPYSLGDCCLHAYWNMVYHEGQINYIQTLYGDTEEHY